ncbi:hypothetical protein NG798_10975 [Ancylothrix sp. C2]|uniref:hypothetical protein n=1 Tax=Ancylothrix sp. D3o TaxID=2953691 RepID=UPI0021BA961C|nr:hypothetical protein [Ancylothrix sp. D3o]MCT7950312.1 hypothetical protein [Ancylothrix sp. D3o]
MATINQNEIASLGASLHEINPKLLKSEKDGTTRLWYQGEEPYFDIFLDIKNQQIVWFQVALRGKNLCWSQEKEKIETGRTNELKAEDISYYPASKLITPDTTPDQNFIVIVRSILETRGDFPLFKQIIQIFDKMSR